ncbi:kinetochore-associated protein DSN1 homolog isoform X2 [Myiozetetes cayanensis]|uniref:kinetochore-associated protein DSN1 homolog isoform X2 n=1 Tax=Myiozetetes cayanensis TaxID=478635 RepID=UPI00215EE123|nr:kinetochore-associated protein DSN1 homolog isoform X2 [Myiozetetes cayanensis]
MAEPSEAAAGPTPAAPPSPRAPGGLDGERCPGGARPEPGGAAGDPEPGAQEAGAEPFLKPPAARTPGASIRKRRLGTPKPRLSPLRSSPRRRGSSPRAKQIHQPGPARERASLHADPLLFPVQSVSAELERLVQRLSQDGTLRDCVEDPKGGSLHSALDESVAQVKQHMARFSAERQAWDQLLQQHQDSAQEAARLLESLRAHPRGPPPAVPSSQSAVLGSKPDYSRLLQDQGPALHCLELVLDELCQAGGLLTAFSEESQCCLRGVSERLGSRTFRQLESSPLCRLLAAPPPEG